MAPPFNSETDRDLLGAAGLPKPGTLPPPNRRKTSDPPPIQREGDAGDSGRMRRDSGPMRGDPGAPMRVKAIEPGRKPGAVIAPIPPLIANRGTPAVRVPAPAKTPKPPTVPTLENEDGEFDAMKTYQVEPKPRETKPRAATPRPPTRLATGDGSVDTDVSTQAIDEDSPATETFETATNESTSFSQKPRKPSSTMETQSAPDDDQVMTTAREKVGQTDMDLPVVKRAATATSPNPVVPPADSIDEPATIPAPVPPAADEAPTERPRNASGAQPKLPITTADASLPPPSEKQAATSGPSPACPQCEAPMAWVEAHLRFYCKSCKMYF
jgi:hypothetical protein